MAADGEVRYPTIRVVILSMDHHLAGPVADAERSLRQGMPGVQIELHAASDWVSDAVARSKALNAINSAHIIIAGMLFLEEHIAPILPALKVRANSCDAIVGVLSAPEIVNLTRLGRFQTDKPETGLVALLKRLRGGKAGKSAGAAQARMLRHLPKLLRFIPGTAQDVRAYFLSMQYWLAGSSENILNLVSMLVSRYAAADRDIFRDTIAVAPPTDYPDTGIYHPQMVPSIGTKPGKLPLARSRRPSIGLLIMRSYVLAGETRHYDAVITAFEDLGYRVIPAFASGLDARPAIESYFLKEGKPQIDALVSLTGFSLVGGPAYNSADDAVSILKSLDVPYVAAHALEFQSLTSWAASARGLSPVESTMMVAIPELDGATGPTVFGGRNAGDSCTGCDRSCLFDQVDDRPTMVPCTERIEKLAQRVDALARLRHKPASQRLISFVLFNFPPGSGAAGTAANLAVFPSLFNTLKAMAADGYDVDVPNSVDELRNAVLEGNAQQYGADGNVVDTIPREVIIENEPRLREIEAVWGPAPGRHQSDGRSVQILGCRFGQVFVGLQPAFGVEGDPMRLLFEGGHAPTHAFAAFYRYLTEHLNSDAIVHFGTHGALEFMPGKQSGTSARCWADHLMGTTPHLYFYAANNPSEAAIAKRRAGATTISYLTPSITKAGLYKGLADLGDTITRWRSTDPNGEQRSERASLRVMAQAQAAMVGLAEAEPPWDADDDDGRLSRLMSDLRELEETLIPDGLHVAGEAMSPDAKSQLLEAMQQDRRSGSSAHPGGCPDRPGFEADLDVDHEIPALLRGLDARFIPPVSGGDLIRNPGIVPTGRNIHGFDPYRMPSRFAIKDGTDQANKLLARYQSDSGRLPESVAIVLWGTDNLKSEGAQFAQALSLLGANPRFDHYGRLSGAELIDLDTLERPRIDVIATLSGIFRDLLPLQTRVLAEAARLAAMADEPLSCNFVRKHSLRYQERMGCTLEQAALRVFSNADGAYGANVNQMIDASCWQEEDDLADVYEKRKCFAYGIDGQPEAQPQLLKEILSDVDTAYQNLDCVELGVTTIDHYFDSLGGIGRAVKRAQGGTDLPVYISDQTCGEGKIRTLTDQVALETRTRTLNPKWYESMLRHGYEGVRSIEAQITNTLGWSATTGQVAPWVYTEITKTFVLDKEMRDRLSALNPKASARVADRLIEASERQYWTPDAASLEALQRFGEEVEDRIEGVLPASGANA